MSDSNRTLRSTPLTTASMEEIVQASEQRLANLLNDTKTELRASIEKVIITGEVKELREHVESIEHDMGGHDTRIHQLQQQLEEEKQARQCYERQFLLKDIHDRKTNLLVYGIKETPQESTETVLRQFFEGKLNFEQDRVNDMKFKAAHRLPLSEYQRKNNPTASRSIICTFIQMKDRDAVLEARKLLKGSGMSIQTDLPPMLKKRRAILSRQAAAIREKDNLWTRVRVVDVNVILETRNPQVSGSNWIKYD